MSETSRAAVEVAGGGRPVALGGIAAPSEVTCLLQARRLPMPNRFLALVVSAVRSGLALPPPVLAPPLSVALLAIVVLGDWVAVLPVRKFQLSDGSAVGYGRE